MSKKHPKMDRYLISNQKWEIRLVRVIWYRFKGEVIEHPDTDTVKSLIKRCNNSRKRVYRELELLKFERVTAK